MKYKDLINPNPHVPFWHSYGLEQEQLAEQKPPKDPEPTGQLI